MTDFPLFMMYVPDVWTNVVNNVHGRRTTNKNNLGFTLKTQFEISSISTYYDNLYKRTLMIFLIHGEMFVFSNVNIYAL